MLAERAYKLTYNPNRLNPHRVRIVVLTYNFTLKKKRSNGEFTVSLLITIGISYNLKGSICNKNKNQWGEAGRTLVLKRRM